jgi:hypothetical protein
VGIAEDSFVEGRAGRDDDRDAVEGEGDDGGGVAVAVAVAVAGLVGGEGSRLGRPWKDMALVHQTEEEEEEEETKVVGWRTLVVEQGYLFFSCGWLFSGE